MNTIIDYIPLGKKRPNIKMNPEYITVHSTGNTSSTAKGERNWLTNKINLTSTSFHIAVDENDCIICLPLNEVAWHAGDGNNGPGNRKSIGVEICESGNREKTLINASKVVASLLFDHNLTLDKIRQHYDWSGKNCPRILRTGNLWKQFLTMVKVDFDKLKNPEMTVEEAVNIMADKHIISNKEHWIKETAKVEYLDILLINMAKYIKGVK